MNEHDHPLDSSPPTLQGVPATPFTNDRWAERDARRHGWPTTGAYPWQTTASSGTVYTRQYHTTASDVWFHAKWGLISLLTAGLAGPLWWLAWRKRNRPVTATSGK